MAYLILKNYTHLWKNEAKDDEIKEMKYRSQKQEYESLKSLKKDSEYLGKKKKNYLKENIMIYHWSFFRICFNNSRFYSISCYSKCGHYHIN